MFWSLSLSSISLATETPSLVTVGAPNERSSTTLRPFGPRVPLTPLARMLTPSTIFARALSQNTSSLEAMFYSPEIDIRAGAEELLDQNGHDVFFAHDQQLFAVDLDGLAGVFAEQNAIADLYFEGAHGAVFLDFTVADGQDFALIGLFSSCIRDDQAGCGFGFLFETLDDDAIVQRAKVHIRL